MVIVDARRTTFRVEDDGTVFRQVRGEWKPVASGSARNEAISKARNLKAIRASAAARVARRNSNKAS